ncbi:hypothetical protein JOF28_001499 [Leucobacter exalbidus]|uniref:Lipoprotein n=1 Tax=Leucobacter exalbidus TaxID=662960 RepID=A0A940T3L2_9MICO|nr:hypothetical protein [Leucobacter exalbidus]MBP1326267.1 hypothetical protein [Leucobacter exalbidus]
MFATARSLIPAALIAATAGLVALTGCAAAEPAPVEVMDQATAAEREEALTAVVDAELAASQTEPQGSFSGGPDEDAGGAPARSEFGLTSRDRPLTIVGACSGADGFAIVRVIGGAKAALECAAEGEDFVAQQLFERQIPVGPVITIEVVDAPRGAVWHIGLGGVTK